MNCAYRPNLMTARSVSTSAGIRELYEVKQNSWNSTEIVLCTF